MTQLSTPPRLYVSELRAGEGNDGPLESTDLFLEGRGISFLINVPVGSQASWSLIIDGEHKSGGEIK